MPVILLISLLCVGCFAPSSFAQLDPDAQGEVQLSVANFGVGRLAREGDWAGIQVQMLDTGSAGRDIVLRLSIKDEDGDETQYDRIVTANPGMLQSFWLYSWIPYRGSNLDYELKAYLAIDSGNADVGEFGFRVGRLLGSLKIYNPQIQESGISMAAIIGNHKIGIDQYGLSIGAQPALPFGHELIRNASGLEVDQLPDRWQGLISFDTLIWQNASRSGTSPSRLSPEKARAIRSWVQRGGHLVILLPSSGDPWFAGSHPMKGMLPKIKTPERMEGVDLEAYRTLLTESASVQLPSNAVVYGFTPLDDADPTEAMPILNDQSGKSVVIRRLFGSGMVTVIGLPLDHGQLRRFGLPDADSLWHRVLGLRGEVRSSVEMTSQEKEDVNRRSVKVFDEGLGGAVAKTGRAVQGVFFGVVVFVLYWLLAGPVGYALLKSKKRNQHAWVAFVATTGVFTALAWIGATSMRPKAANVSHLSFIEQVHGQDTQRVRGWMSAMLPSYGTEVVSMRDPEAGGGFGINESSNLLSPWSSPDSLISIAGGFPDNSGYRVESKDPSAIRVPTRATVKSFRVDWAGESRWGLPEPVGTPGELQEPSLKLDGSVVLGQIVHDLPAELKDVRVFVISKERTISRAGRPLGRQMVGHASVFSPDFGADGWLPGQTLDMEQVTRVNTESRRTLTTDYFTSAIRYGVDKSGLDQSTGDLIDRLIAGRFISQFEPPKYNAAKSDPVGDRLAVRRSLHGWDLGKWFTQPTLIVMGVIDIDVDDANDNGMPTPMWIQGKKVPASGKTIVTWVYPFEAAPPEHYSVFQPMPEQSDQSSTTDEVDSDESE